MDPWDGTTYRRVLVIADAPVELSVTQDGGDSEAPPLTVALVGRLLGRPVEGFVKASIHLRDPWMGGETSPPRDPLPRERRPSSSPIDQLNVGGSHPLVKIDPCWCRSPPAPPVRQRKCGPPPGASRRHHRGIGDPQVIPTPRASGYDRSPC